jgi:hypothetical protein
MISANEDCWAGSAFTFSLAAAIPRNISSVFSRRSSVSRASRSFYFLSFSCRCLSSSSHFAFSSASFLARFSSSLRF